MGISKQNFHQRMDKWLNHQEERAALIPIIREIRNNHPKMSAREMYKKIQPQTFARDKFEAFCFSIGLKVVNPKNFRKTTNSNGVIRFPNRIIDLELTGVYQVLVSDITYYELKGKFYYLTFIMDLFSREILGYSISSNLKTENTTLAALIMVVQNVGKENLIGTIIHSDGGGQYYAKIFKKMTGELKMVNSMAKEMYENPHAERVNGTIKNAYIIPYNPQNYKELKRDTTKAILMYNTEKPHKSLNGLTPVEFKNKQFINNLIINEKEDAVKTENYSNSNFPVLTAKYNHQYV